MEDHQENISSYYHTISLIHTTACLSTQLLTLTLLKSAPHRPSLRTTLTGMEQCYMCGILLLVMSYVL